MLNLVLRGGDEEPEVGLAGAWQAPRSLGEAEAEITRLRQLVRVLGHELANSLGPMKSLLASSRLLLEDQADAGRLERVLSTVEERAEHLQSFVADCVADCGRVSPVVAPRLAPVDWQRLAARLEVLFPELIVEGVPTPTVACDAVQIEQVLINLLKNAREANGGELRLLFEPIPGGMRVSVLDRGCGMTDVQLAALGRRRFTTKPRGSGIGLDLCRTIVQRHGGRLTVQRRPGGGMKIGFSLPCRAAPSSAGRAAG